MDCKNLIFSGHAVRRMFERGISKTDVRSIIESGETVVDYPDDIPFPTKLLLGFCKDRPVHVVLAYNVDEKDCIVVTTYEPNRQIWKDNFKEKRSP